ncbi:unnamed protein product [Miscanthus lutarioriparius]|uniref:Uncharacterized protein n=1 Tax=Miscanthus lutarioriparius TaxID=422564 RepID=A0A811NMP2_9POAL|nr:unnamed protein product [Miscanthus lutarioriparius]
MATTAVSASPASSGGVVRRRRVLMFPLPFQGHLNPMLQLAGVLHARGGLDITVFHGTFNAPDPARHPPEYRFVPVGEGVAWADLVPSGGGGDADDDIPGALLRINERLREPFRDRLRQALALAEDDAAPPPACLVLDSNLREMQLVAQELGVPTLVLRTGAAACLVAYMAFPALCDKGLLPPTSKDKSQLDMPLDDLTPLRLRDMVFSSAATPANMKKCLKCLVDAARSSSGVILNTFRDLENSDLEKIANGIAVPIYPIGPLHKISSGTADSLLAQDWACLEWLDKQEVDSVLYVSFGSLACIDEKELLEIAWGLANSQVPFLWVIRHNLVKSSSNDVSLPDGFKEETHGRGMVVPWVPQQEVLRHHAIGGFWTHNGWNSTLESICEGVPMICRPQFADQMINMRYVQDVWKIGFELDGDLERGKIERAVTKLLCMEEGRHMRQRAKDLRNKAIKCIKEEGTSKSAIELLVNHIMSF